MGEKTNLVDLVRKTPASGPAWARQLRSDALARFEEAGFPTPKDEEWRQTRVDPITSTRFARGEYRPGSISRAELDALALGNLDCPRIVLVNGRFAEDLSDLDALPEGVAVTGLAAAFDSRPDRIEPHLGSVQAPSGTPFAALNTAALDDGVVVTVEAGNALRSPIQIVHLSESNGTPVAVHPRTLVVVGERAEAELIETYASRNGGEYLTNAVTEVSLGAGANLYHDRVQWESRSAFHVGAIHTCLARNANYVGHNISFGAALARHDIGGKLDGEGAEATLNGMYLVRGEQHVDNHTTLEHASARCPSHELYKGILADRAKAVFNGRIIVREGAQKTDAKQSNRNLLLSDDALVHTRPQLEIYADDVRCTHGATVGQLEDDALFYLRARGIGAAEARSILIYAFASDVLDRIRHAPLRDRLESEMMTVVGEVLAPGAAS
jgi:Fe-S cluster assembly protein SufD